MERPGTAELSAERNHRTAFAGELAVSRAEVLRAHGGGDLEVYEQLLRDAQVHATFQQRRSAVVSMPWTVEAGGDRPIDIEAADFLRATLKRIRWDRVTHKMLSDVFYGYAVSELIYGSKGRHITLEAIKVRRANRFRFTPSGNLVLLNGTGGPLEMPPAKFWTFTAGSDDDDGFYGRGLGHYLYWPVWFKRNAMRFWSLWLEKLVTGTPIAKGPTSMNDADETKLLSLLEAVTNGGRVVIPKSVEIEILESARNSGGDYDVFYTRCDKAISKVVLSQTLTTDAGASYSQALVHGRVGDAVAISDADLVCESFNQGPVRWLTDWNFDGAAYPSVWREGLREEDLNARAQRDAALASIGYHPTEEYIREVYGDGYEPVERAEPTGARSSGYMDRRTPRTP